jgi:hypothetical protein
MQRQVPDNKMTAGELLRVNVRVIVARYATVDGELSGIEARAYEQLGTDMEGLGDLVESAGSLRYGKLYDSVASLVTESHFEDMQARTMDLIKTAQGPEALKEYVLALRALAAATCSLDGRSEQESDALRDLDAFLKKTLAELG